MPVRQEPLYNTWRKMIERCYNTNCIDYKFYGARGIKMSLRWRKSFYSFKKDVGDKPVGYSLDRVDNNKGYYKSNCRWATQKTQTNNTRRNVFIEYNGARKTISEWANFVGMKPSVLFKRIYKGVEFCEAINPELRSFKLTKEDISKIRSLRGKMSQKDVSRMFGVTQTQVSKVQLGCAWADKYPVSRPGKCYSRRKLKPIIQ